MVVSKKSGRKIVSTYLSSFAPSNEGTLQSCEYILSLSSSSLCKDGDVCFILSSWIPFSLHSTYWDYKNCINQLNKIDCYPSVKDLALRNKHMRRTEFFSCVHSSVSGLFRLSLSDTGPRLLHRLQGETDISSLMLVARTCLASYPHGLDIKIKITNSLISSHWELKHTRPRNN